MESISLIENILASHQRVMPKLYNYDKWPNIDGFLEVQDKDNNIIGRIFAQGKTLPQKNNFKIRLPISFFSSCEINPIMLLAVDNNESKVYWEYFDSDKIKNIDFKNNASFKTLSLDNKSFFDKENKSYIPTWEKIARRITEKIQKFNSIEEAYKLILESTNEDIGKSDNKFINIHIFLDELNYLIDQKFPIIKRIFFINAWKIGFAYYEYEKSNLSYILYPIFMNENDANIKKIDKVLYKKLDSMNLDYRSHSAENPIIIRPKKYANKLVKSFLLRLIENKNLNYENEFIAKEFIFAFIDRFYNQMGLIKKKSYRIEEIEKAFFKHLVFWIEETFKLLSSSKRINPRLASFNKKNGLPIVNLNIVHGISRSEAEEISLIVKKRINNNERCGDYYLVHDNLPVGIFIELFNYLKKLNFTKVKRVYKEVNEKRLQKLKSPIMVWNLFSKDEFIFNMKVFYKNLKKAFDEIVNNNFSLREDKISFFGDADKIDVYLKFSTDKNGLFIKRPIYDTFYMKLKSGNQKKSINLNIIENKSFSFLDLEKEIECKNKNYTILHSSSSSLDFIYEETPMINFIQNLLFEKINEYFE